MTDLNRYRWLEWLLHIGDEGKFGSVKASFYPGNPPINYHSKRLDELKEIGYDPPFAEKSRTEANANTAFYVGASSEFDVVAYNENWVAVWSEGGVDESRGSIIDCSGRKTVELSQAGNREYIFCQEKLLYLRY